MKNLIVTSSPHIHKRISTMSVMADVIVALLPATVAAVILFGLRALLIIATCVTTAVAAEFIFNLCAKKKQTIGDLSAVLTGLLLALNLSLNVTLWQCIVGSVFAIVIVKCVFGGIGHNFANPAITARVFLLVCFTEVAGGAFPVDVVASATPLDLIGAGAALPSVTEMLLGQRGGAIGETCGIALIIGFVYLLCRKIISWHTPVIFVGTVFAFYLLLGYDLNTTLVAILSGGLLIGAIFMATDYVTTPMSSWGKVIFGLGCGILTVLIRVWGSYPEGVSFAILFMNILTPFIDKLCAPKVIGGVKNEK
jgi:electron transport complex protein RnfD